MKRDDRQDKEAMERRRAIVDAIVASARQQGTPITPWTAALYEAYVEGRLDASDVLAVIMKRHGEQAG